MNQNENIKIGARVLNKKQATVLLPNYQKIHKQIDQFRREAKKFNNALRSKEIDDYEKHEIYSNFDNVISILGERGSGKTSVFFTLKDIHQTEFREVDLTLPLIVPDNMGNTNDTLGWIISYLDDYVEKLHPILKTKEKKICAYNGFNNYVDYEDSELKERFKRLRKTYEIRKEVYLNKVLKRDEGTKEYINDKAKITLADQSLILEFNSFINCLIEAKKQVNINGNIEPLILIFFDDVDLSAHRCPEVLETIRNYLNHPNIVVFVSGDFKVFSEIICLEFLKKEGVNSDDYDKVFIPNQQLGNQETNLYSALELRKERSQEYLKKVLPPSFRFYMKKLTDRDKSRFSYEFTTEKDSKGPTLSELLAKIENNGKKFVWEFRDSEGISFKNNEQIPFAFFEIFDDNPRGLINPYYYLYQKIYLNEVQSWDISDINHFLQIILHSSVKLQKYKEIIENLIVINESDKNIEELNSMVHINYDLFLDSFTNGEINKRRVNLEREEIITIYILCMFIEKLTKIVIKDYSNTSIYSTENLLVKILNQKTKGLFPNIKNDDLLLQMYSVFENKVLLNNNKLFDKDNKGTKKAEEIFFETLNYSMVTDTTKSAAKIHDLEHINLIRLFKVIFSKDEKWVTNVIEFINNNGKSYEEIFYSIRSQSFNQLDFLNKNQRVQLFKKLMSFNFLYEEEIKRELYNQFDKLQNTYSETMDISPRKINNFISWGSELEKLVQNRKVFEEKIKDIEENLAFVLNQKNATQVELENIKDQEQLIKTRKRMLRKIRELEAFTQNDLRRKEWRLLKNNFVIARETPLGEWIDSSGTVIDMELVQIFDPKKSSLKNEGLLQESLDGVVRVGLFVNDKHMLPREDIIDFIEKYFIEDQEILLLKACLPLDVEGRKKQILDLNVEINSLDNEMYKIKTELNNIEDEINLISKLITMDFKIDIEIETINSATLSDILQLKFKEYLLSSIYQQIKEILIKQDVILETEALLEVLKIYEDSIEEARNFASQEKLSSNLRYSSTADTSYIHLNKDDINFLVSLLKQDIPIKLRNYIIEVIESGRDKIYVGVVTEILKELKDFQKYKHLSQRNREKIFMYIDKFEKYTNEGTINFEEDSEIEIITLPVLNEIIIPYIFTRILVENRRINEETSTVYFRGLKKELADFVYEEKEHKKQTRFVRSLEKMLNLD